MISFGMSEEELKKLFEVVSESDCEGGSEGWDG